MKTQRQNKAEYITLTGLDQSVSDFSGFKKLAEDNRNVEYGVLFSYKNNKPRYPTTEHILKIVTEIPKRCLSAHLCGEYANAFVNTGFLPLLIKNHFTRIQLNYSDYTGMEYRFANILETFQKKNPDIAVVLQVNEKNHKFLFDAISIVDRKKEYNSLSSLLDLSGGTGLELKELPSFTKQLQNKTNYLGFAGGFSSLNIKSKLEMIHKAGYDNFGIDMESSLRNEKNEFSLEDCQVVVENVKSFYNSKTA